MARKLVLQGLEHGRGIIRAQTDFGTGLPRFQGRDKCAAFGQGFGGLVVFMAADLPAGLAQKRIFGFRIILQQPGKGRTGMMPAPGLDKGFGSPGQPGVVAGHVALALVGRGNAQFGFSFYAHIFQSPLKSADRVIIAVFFQKTHSGPEIILGLSARAQKQAV